MPVTSRSLLINHVNGAGKKAPTNLRYSPVKKQTVNTNCACNIPNTISINYTLAGSYTTYLPLLPPGYLWQINGTVTSGGGGGGGGGGGIDIFGSHLPGGGGGSNLTISTQVANISTTGDQTITSVVGAGGAGGAGGGIGMPGIIGGMGSASYILLMNGITFGSTIIQGGFGGMLTGLPTGQIGGSGPGSSGSGGNGSTSLGSSGLAGRPGADGSVIFTATPIRV
jgi:hypothetical protein